MTKQNFILSVFFIACIAIFTISCKDFNQTKSTEAVQSDTLTVESDSTVIDSTVLDESSK